MPQTGEFILLLIIAGIIALIVFAVKGFNFVIDTLSLKMYVRKQRKLAKIAASSSHFDVCQAALNALHDFDLTLYVFETTNNGDIRSLAADKLYRLVADVARQVGAESASRLEKMIAKINDQSLLMYIVKNSSEYRCYTGAMKKLTDQELIVDFFKSDEDSMKRNGMIEQLTDSTTLACIAENNDESWYMRLKAVAKLSDKTLARRIFSVLSERTFPDNYDMRVINNSLQEACGKIGHEWDGCVCVYCAESGNHAWDGCKCKRCGKTRDEQHDWDGCKCKRCGRIGNHNMDGCVCTRCGYTEHDWRYTGPGGVEDSGWVTPSQTCNKCGKYEILE